MCLRNHAMTEQSTKDSQQLTGSPTHSHEASTKTRCPEPYLLEENMVSISTLLDRDQLQRMEQQNECLTKTLNRTQYQLRKQVEHKLFLQHTLDALRRDNQKRSLVQTTAIEELGAKYEDCERRAAFAEIEAATCAHVLRRTRAEVAELSANVARAKEMLGRTDAIYAMTNGVRTEGEVKAESHEEGDAGRRLAEANEEHEDIERRIREMKAKTKTLEEESQYRRLKQEKLEVSIRRIKERREYFSQFVSKLKRYHDEYKTQFQHLTETFQANKKSEILARKERRDIEQQSEKNDYTERVQLLQSLSATLCSLKETLAREKALHLPGEERVRLMRTYDKGEYNADAPSSAYVDQRLELRRAKNALEEKLGFVRTVISGIKHILLKLRDNDQEDETGTWYNLTVVAAIDDISTPEMRPKFSKLLMILEQKITCLYTLILQKVRHIPVYMADVVVTPEEIADRPPPDIELIPEKTVLECCVVLRRQMNGSGLTRQGTLATHRGDHRASILTEEELKEPLTGAEVPRIAGKLSKALGTTPARGPVGAIDENPEAVPYQTQPNEQPEMDGIQRGLANMDMMAINANLLELMFQQKRPTKERLSRTAVNPKELEAALNEQLLSKASFNKGRTKVKMMEKELKRRTEPNEKLGATRKSKKRVTDLTIAIANAMRKKPAEVVDIATTTFDTMEKLRRGGDIRAIREAEDNPTLMPNFLNVILGMKRSRGEEDISRIASHCKYFTNTAVRWPDTGLGRLAKPKRTALLENENLIDSARTVLHRLANVKSLNKLESTTPGFCTAFEKYAGHKAGTLPRILSSSRTSLAAANAIYNCGKRSHVAGKTRRHPGRNGVQMLAKYKTTHMTCDKKFIEKYMMPLGTFTQGEQKGTRSDRRGGN